MNLDELRKKFEDGVALQPLWNEDDNLPFDEKSKVYAVMHPMHLSLSTLKCAYEVLCEEYRRRLCEMWGFDFKDSYWIPDNRIGEVVAICDGEYTFGMEDLRYFVEYNTSFEDFSEWWRYNLVNPKRQINAYSWFALGARPEMLNDKTEKK